MNIQSFMESSSLNQNAFQKKLLEVLAHGNPAQEELLVRILEKKFFGAKNGASALTFSDLSYILEVFHRHGLDIDPTRLESKTPFSQPAFYRSIRENFEDTVALKDQLRILQEEGKTEKGFFRTHFNLFTSQDPIEKAVQDIVEFEKYCRKNGITFDEVSQQLVVGKKPDTAWTKIKDYRFLLTAVAGGALGMGGINLAEQVPVLGALPGFFFQALPYIALPFISLNIFRAFSEKSMMKEIGTFGRFAALMGMGVLIGLGVTSAMSGLLTPLNEVAEIVEAAVETPFSPSQYILHGIGLFAIFSSVYKAARSRVSKGFNEVSEAGGQLSAGLSAVFRKAVEKTVETGKLFEKAARFVDKLFINYLDFVGMPAIAVMLSKTLAEGGFKEMMASYGGYYATVAVGMLTCAAALGGAARLYGCRKKEFREMAKTTATAFGISSSAATMPVTKESLKQMGVSKATRNSVVPLGANFNMMGTSLYLGVTASCATVMYGLDPTLGQMAGIMGLSVATAFGMPGTPASTILFLDPVLQKAGLSPEQAAKIYEMVIPMDRFFDMGQTALNVTGDMVVSLDTDRALKIKRARNMDRIRTEKLSLNQA